MLRLRHKDGVLHYINLLSIGFTADVATMRARRFSGWGEAGYQTSIFIWFSPPLAVARFVECVDGERNIDRRLCLFLLSATANLPAGA